MRTTIFLALCIITFSESQAQFEYPPERIIVVATMDRGLAIPMGAPASAVLIKKNVIETLGLLDTNFEMVNQTLKKRAGLGWFLQYEFESDDKIGVYREQLHERDGQLVITESRNAEMAMSTNCQKIVFTNDDTHCECVDSKIIFFDTKLTHRLFFTVQ